MLLSPGAVDCSASVTRSDLSSILAVDYREILRPGLKRVRITDPRLMLNSIHTLDSYQRTVLPPRHFAFFARHLSTSALTADLSRARRCKVKHFVDVLNQFNFTKNCVAIKLKFLSKFYFLCAEKRYKMV